MFKKMLLVFLLGSFMAGTAFAGVKEMEAAWNYEKGDKATCVAEANKILADESSSPSHIAQAKRFKVFCLGVEETPITSEELKELRLGGIEYLYFIKDKSTPRFATLKKEVIATAKPIFLGDSILNRGYYVQSFMLEDLGGQDFLLKLLQRDGVFQDNYLKKLLAKCTKETLAKVDLKDKAREFLRTLDWGEFAPRRKTMATLLKLAQVREMSQSEIDELLTSCYKGCYDKAGKEESLSILANAMSPEAREALVGK